MGTKDSMRTISSGKTEIRTLHISSNHRRSRRGSVMCNPGDHPQLRGLCGANTQFAAAIVSERNDYDQGQRLGQSEYY